MKRLSVAISLALCFALPASAQMYKWVDSNGKVQYSDKPPPSSIKAEKLRPPPPAPPAPGASAASEAQKGAAQAGTQKDAAKAAPKTAAEQEQAFRKRQLDAAKAQEEEGKKQADARDKADKCQRSKAALAGLELGGRQTRVDEKGERVYLDEQQIAQETAKARRDVAAACN